MNKCMFVFLLSLSWRNCKHPSPWPVAGSAPTLDRWSLSPMSFSLHPEVQHCNSSVSAAQDMLFASLVSLELCLCGPLKPSANTDSSRRLDSAPWLCQIGKMARMNAIVAVLCGSLNPDPNGSCGWASQLQRWTIFKACALWLVRGAELSNALCQYCSLQTFPTSASHVSGYLSLKPKIPLMVMVRISRGPQIIAAWTLGFLTSHSKCLFVEMAVYLVAW